MATKRRPRFPMAISELVERLEVRHGHARLIARFEPMEELISCIMSQHTTDANSFPAFTRLRATFPTWQAMVDAGPEGIAPVIQNAGLANQKSKSIHRCLTEIHARLGDYTLEPLRQMTAAEARDWLLQLPGVGPKTAAIVLCFSLGMDAIPVDTHVFRVTSRLGLLPEGMDERKAHDHLLTLVPSGWTFRFHITLIQHGRTICRAPKPLCAQCELADVCRYAKRAA